MTFTPNIPQSGQTLGSSRTQVLNNFTNYNNLVSVNHNAPNSSGEGKHKFVQMPVQSPVPVTLAGEGGLFTQGLSTDLTKSILYYQRDANTTVNQPVMPLILGTFITRNTNGACTVVMGYNITSITRISSGVYAVAFAITIPYTVGVTEYGVLLGKGNGATISSLTFDSTNGSGFHILVSPEDAGARVTFSVYE